MIVKRPIKYAIIIDRQGDCGVFDTMNDAIELAYKASEEFSRYSLSRKNEIIDVVTKELETHLKELTQMTCKENETSSFDDIFYENTIALNSSKNDKYLEAKLSANNKTSNSENSYIVNGVITSSSNPVETIIKNSILALKSESSVVFSSNQNLQHVIAYVVKLINKAIATVDGPKNLIVTVKNPDAENTHIMIENEKITLISTVDNHTSKKIAL